MPNEDKFDVLALALNLLINLVQNTKHIYKHLMETNMPGDSTQKIYEYLAHVRSNGFVFNIKMLICRFFVHMNRWQLKLNLKKKTIG